MCQHVIYCTLLTRADHGPEGDGVDHAADGGRVARAQLVARVAAPLIQA